MKHNFRDKTAKIIAEICNRTCINKIDIEVLEVLEDILQEELVEYDDALHDWYDAGYDDGYANGYASLEEDVDNAYDEGYALGYSEGRSDGHYDGYSAGYSDCRSEV